MKRFMKGLMVAGLMAAVSTTAFAKTASIKVGDKEMKLDISGFAQVALINNEVNMPAGVGPAGNTVAGTAIGIGDYVLSAAGDTTFTVNRLQLSVVAQPNDNITTKASFELGRNFNAGNESRLVDGIVDLNYIKGVTVRLGQFPIPIGLEIEKSPYSLDFVNYTLFTNIYGQRNRGAMVYGDLTENVSFDLGIANGIMNGNLTGAANEAQSDAKQWFGRLSVTPAENLLVALFADVNKWDAAMAGGVKTKVKNVLWGLGGAYSYMGLGLEAAYGENKTSVTGATAAKVKDLYGAVTYTIPESDVQLVARYERVKGPSPAAAVPVAKVLTAGFNWNFDKNARLQIQREFWSSNSALSPKANSNDVTMIQLGVSF